MKWKIGIIKWCNNFVYEREREGGGVENVYDDVKLNVC